MQNINHFLIFSNTYNPKHPPTPHKKKNPPPTKSPQKKSECSECSECSQKSPTTKSPSKKSECSELLPKAPPTTKKAKKKIATRQAGSNHHIKQLLSLNQKI